MLGRRHDAPGLVRRDAGRQEDNPGEPEPMSHDLGNDEMSDVDRIEGAAEDADAVSVVQVPAPILRSYAAARSPLRGVASGAV